MRIGFLVWNRFQVAHFAEIARQFDEPDFILTDRDPRGLSGFDPAWLTKYGAYTRFVSETNLDSLDGQYDVILTQFTPGLAKSWTKTKLVMCQYSMAKPKTVYNARWFISDLSLVYGPYSDNLIGKMSATAQAGNSRFDPFFENRLDPDLLNKVRQSLDPRKKTVLFLPTWGDLSSRTRFEEQLASLAQTYNVIYQPHHLTPIREKEKGTSLGAGTISAESFGPVLDIGPYLMSVADVVLSDMSGAIFDALYCRRPVVLLAQGADYATHKKAEPTALEISEHASIGPLVGETDDLNAAIARVLGPENPFRAANEEMVKRCFVQRGGCAPLAAEAIRAVAEGKVEVPPLQLYAGSQVRGLILPRALMTAKKDSVDPGDILRSNMKMSPSLKVAADGLRRFVAVLPQPAGTWILKNMGWGAGLIGAKKVSEELYLWSARRGSNSAAIMLAKKAIYDGRTEMAVELYRRAAMRSQMAMRHHIKFVHRIGDFVGTGFAIESWMRQKRVKRSESFSQYASAASKMRYSRQTWRRTVQDLKAYWLNMKRQEDSKKRMKMLSRMGFVNTARAFGSAEHRETKELEEIVSNLGTMSHVLEAAAQNEALHSDERLCFSLKNGPMAVPLKQADRQRIFEMAILMNFTREDSEISEGLRPATVEFARHCFQALLSLGYTVLPCLQAGLRGAVPISGRYPSMTWHSVANGIPGQFHLKVGTYRGHVVMDNAGYSGWASIANEPLEKLIAGIEAGEAEQQWQRLYKENVEGGLSKYQQADEAAPLVDDFIFLPTQVLDDTVSVHADVDSLTLIHELAAWNRKTGRPVVVKRHPLCKFQSVQDALDTYAAAGSIIVSNASIHDLIRKAACVVTVNSGVGAEALIHLKPVISTGGSDYAAATTRIRTCEELRDVLDRQAWRSVSDGDVKKFLWLYTKRYMPHSADSDAILARLEQMLGARLDVRTLQAANTEDVDDEDDIEQEEAA